MPKPHEIPEGQAFRDAWTKLDKDARRRVRRAINRGQAVETRKEARVAVGMARSQLRFWRWGWMVGPVVVFALTLAQGIEVAVFNTLIVTVVVAGMALFFRRRALRAEARNLEVVERKRKRKA
ncbi:MAG: hypothetical protein ACQETV_02990 [Actinomycetota bacterium]